MSTGFPYFRSRIAAEIEAIHHAWALLFGWGILLFIGGIIALLYPVAATVASMEVFGVLLLFAAGGQLVAIFYSRKWGGVLSAVLCSILYLFGGVILLERPLLAAAGYTLFLTMLFFAVGIVRITTALIHQFSGWGWVALSGGISVLLAVLIWQDFPASAFWVIGAFIGIDLIFAGWSWMMTGLAVRHLPTHTSIPKE